jgi:hypothetical protein
VEQKMKLLKNNESGQALVLSLALLAFGSLVSVPMLTMASTSLNYHQVIEANTLENYAADAGVEYALCQLDNNWEAYQASPLESNLAINDRTVNIAAEYMGDNIYKITSTAASNDGSNSTIESYLKVIISLFSDAITVTNGDVLLENSTINGDVYCSGDITLQGSSVNGDITENGSVEFELLDTEPYKTEAQSGDIIEGNLVLGAGTHTLGPTYITGYLKIQNEAQVTLGGTVYVEGIEQMADNITICIEGNSSIAGTGNFIAETGNIKIELARFELDNIPLVAAIAGSIKCENTEYMKALLYAPEVSFGIKLEDIPELYGSIFAGTLHVVENCTINYPVDGGGSDLLGGDKLKTLTHQIN